MHTLSASGFRKGTLIPLQKPGKPKGSTANLRPIILLPSLRKTLSLVILNRIRPGVEKYLSPGQSGFRSHRSMADVVWCKRWLSSIVERFSVEIHVLGLDFSKAFDTVNREKLLQVLLSAQIANDDEVRIIRYLMANTTLEVNVESSKSPAFPTTTGIPQGDGLSPVLFTVYLEAALRDLRSALPPRSTAMHSDHRKQHMRTTLTSYQRPTHISVSFWHLQKTSSTSGT